MTERKGEISVGLRQEGEIPINFKHGHCDYNKALQYAL